MENKYTLRYLPVAVDDLISIFDWIANDSPANADAFIEKLDQQIGNLARHPLLGRIPNKQKGSSLYFWRFDSTSLKYQNTRPHPYHFAIFFPQNSKPSSIMRPPT